MSELAPQIAELQDQFAAIKAEAPELVERLSEAQFNWHPSEKSWSIAECLQHLNIVGERYACVLEEVLENPEVRSRTGSGPFELGWLGKWMVQTAEPPPKHRFQAPRSYRPAHGQPFTAVMPTFLHLQDQLSLLAGRANELDLGRIKARGLGLKSRLNLYATFAWIAAHERRHVWQAWQVRRHAAFPPHLTGRGY